MWWLNLCLNFVKFHEIFDISKPKNIFLFFHTGGGSTRGSVGSVSGGTKQQQVSAYLASHPDFLENYVMNNVDMETMERWTIRKARQFNNKGNGGKTTSTSTDLYRF